MADIEETNEIFEEKNENVAEVVVEPKAEVEEPVKTEKKKKPKRVISEEQKQRLRENLAKGRATSLANRKKKAQLRKIKKEEDSKADDEKIFRSLKKKLEPDALKGENESLKKELEILKNEMKSMREAKPKPAPKQKLIQVLETPEVIERPIKDRREAMKPEEVIEEAPPPPPPPAKKEMSKRDIMRMMRGL